MTIRPNITDDFEDFVDNLVPIVLTIRGSGATYYVTHAHRNQVSVQEPTPGGGDLKQGDTIWQFPQEEAPVDTIPLGSTLTLNPTAVSSGIYDSEIWTIQAVSKQIWSTKWEVRARNLGVESGLNTLVDILRATYTSNYDGEMVPDWAVYALNVPAKIQPVSNESDIRDGMEYSTSLFDVTLATQPTFDPGVDYRIADYEGNLYAILSARNLGRIDTLPVLRVRKLTGYSSSGIA